MMWRERPSNFADEADDEGVLVLEQHFAIVPEWVLDAEISDAALRLYAVLLRYGQSSGHRMPGRRLLASRLHKRSRYSVDRALKELVGIGAVVVQRRCRGPVSLTNRYVVRSTDPRRRTSSPAPDHHSRRWQRAGDRRPVPGPDRLSATSSHPRIGAEALAAFLGRQYADVPLPLPGPERQRPSRGAVADAAGGAAACYGPDRALARPRRALSQVGRVGRRAADHRVRGIPHTR